MVTAEKSTHKDFGIKHLAVIMDGNRRWAKNKGLPSIEGHRAGVTALKSLVRSCPNHGIQYLTVYAFSTENWKRPEGELDFLFSLLAEVAISELKNLIQENVRVSFIGDLTAFTNAKIRNSLESLAKETENNTGLRLQIALNYGSIQELSRACKSIKDQLSEEEIRDLDPKTFASYLYTNDCPDPEIVIRTGGQARLSNYLLWQTANADLHFIDSLWPDFTEATLTSILETYTKT